MSATLDGIPPHAVASMDSPSRTGADVSTDKSDSPASWTSQHAASTLHALASAGSPMLNAPLTLHSDAAPQGNVANAAAAPVTAASLAPAKVAPIPRPRAPKKKSSTSNANSAGAQASSSKNTLAGASDAGSVARRRKANRACSACQKAHLTCDDCEYPF